MKLTREKNSNDMRLFLRTIWDKHESMLSEVKLTEFEQSFTDSILKRDFVLSEKQWTVAKRMVRKHLGITIDDGTPEEESPQPKRGASVRK